MKANHFFVLISSTLIISCSSRTANEEYVSPDGLAKVPAGTNTPVQTQNQITPTLQQDGKALQNMVPVTTTTTTQPVQQTNNTISAVSVPATAQTTSTAKGMNPAHGQPGHRCDIAVGAPLNSKPAANQVTNVTPVTTTTVSPATTTISPATTAKTKTAPGMNPPHGEPGHRCDIGVGLPLNTPVTKPAVVNTPTTTTTTPTGTQDTKPVTTTAVADSGK